MKTESPRDLFFDQLRDLYSVEIQLSKGYPLLVARVYDHGLQKVLSSHAEDTSAQQEALHAILKRYDISFKEDKSMAIEGLIEGGATHLDGVEYPPTRDLMMIAHCLRIEHYEMAAYGITARLASQLGYAYEAAALARLLAEHENAAKRLWDEEPRLFEAATR